MRFLGNLDGPIGDLPAALVAEIGSAAERRALLREVTARALGAAAAEVAIGHEDGRPPRLIRPSGTGLRLSSASRDRAAALAVARGPVGVDVERVEPAAGPPWNVLHPSEREMLLGLPAADLPRAFTRLWTCKEAYLKALGLGLSRGPDTFEVAFLDEERAAFRDPAAPESKLAEARTWWWARRGETFAVSVVTLGMAARTEA